MAARTILIGSTEAYSGKSAAILGLAEFMRRDGLRVTYGKPIGACMEGDCLSNGLDPDIQFMADTLDLSPDDIPPVLLRLDEDAVRDRIAHPDAEPFAEALQSYCQGIDTDVAILEGPGTLHEGELFGMSLRHMAARMGAKVVLIARYESILITDALLVAGQQLQEHLAGVIINDVSEDAAAKVADEIVPYLEQKGIPILGVLPANRILRSISVAELVHQLEARILCCEDRLDLMVEEFTIGAMNVNSALKYFRKAQHQAVITGGDRTDIQLAALETSTHCLILTGQLPPSALILARAEELEVPILSVDLDTLTTVERIERVFGQVRLHEAVKVRCIQELILKNCDLSRLYTALELVLPVAS
ncbi:MAG: phosphotransacetylase family protein [Cyanobacteria bacterium J06642_2]